MLQRFNDFLQKRMAFVTPTCMIVGILFSDYTRYGIPYVSYVFAVMTFIGALKSSFKDVKNVFRHPLPLITVFVLLHVVLPSAAWGAGHLFFSSNPNLITGMVLEFSVPAAVVGLMWVSIYNGNNTLALALVVVDTVLAPFVIPTTLRILGGANVQMDTTGMMKDLIFMIAIPALLAMSLNQISGGKVKETWPQKLAPWSKICMIFVVTSNSSKVAPYVKHMTFQRVCTALTILALAATAYALGWGVALLMKQKQENVISMAFGSGLRNISAGAVIAAQYFPGEVLFPVMIATLFQQMLAACYGKLIVKSYIKNRYCSQVTSKQ